MKKKIPTSNFKIFFAVVILNIAILISACGTKNNSTEMSGKNLSMIDEFVNVGLKAKLYKGAVVLVARNGQISYFKAFGEDGKGKPMQKDAIFRLASMTKPLVMAALMQFYDKGVFKLDDPLSKFIPEFKALQVAIEDEKGNIKLVPAKREITMHDLMSYTAGFTCTFYYGASPVNNYVTKSYVDNGVKDLFNEEYNHTMADNVKNLAKSPLAYQPGEGWLYAHTSHDIIGYLVEKFSGMTLDKYMDSAIFKPLKMNETWFFPPESVFSRIPEPSQPGNADSVFVEKKLGLLTESQKYTFGKKKIYLSGGGGLHATITDYFRFAQMMLNKGELDGIRILSTNAVELMTRPTGDKFKANGLTGNTWVYGLEAQINDMPGEPNGLGGKGSYGWRGIWSTLWNNNPENGTVTLYMSQVGDDGFYPYIINSIVGSAVIK